MWNGELLDLDAYLTRVGFRPDPDADAITTLRGLHRAHLRSISFENADIVLGVPITLDVPSLQEKMVRHRRGGYCYEQNLLFAAVLERFGFEVTALAARVLLGREGDLPRTHALLRVDRKWLVDVGFGNGGLLTPLPLLQDAFEQQGDWAFRLDLDDALWTLSSYQGGEWLALYDFTEDPRTRADFEILSYYLSTHPSSAFVGRLLVQRTDEHARYAIADHRLTVATPAEGSRKRVLTPEERATVLRDDFGLELPAEVERPTATG
ncbi:arylamine N-acetyltransferase [Actinosynnema sp. NPDC047251]|uniref:N-hydroxyarylamine O-acetyltransferase n=1 Tax=Saccharothrix espanaensis (strain ATCC 51144 / DSM 44229 / JCM 9112 / NBRC 15066 / NRRL 15764) TaxID=1179773 RepID=K0JU72_SACES|nr:arylamine N-acetyltransferase [Saccharothrix espanaensis]CCH29042.1 N-hydroxyarylamine O-acetyltransferase [Saccharothrix espanaensis DSM 44229]